MCGRFTLTVDPAELKDAFGEYIFPEAFAPRYNIAPTQPVLAIPNRADHKAAFFLWGLIPSWSRDPGMATRLINARSETAAEKPSFRGSFKYKRCLVPADGFYEWKAVPGAKGKVPHYIRMRDHAPFALAGLWDEWHSPDGGILATCTLLTTSPNELMAGIHDRMPVILPREAYADWLDPSPRAAETLQGLMKPFPAGLMEAHPVTTLVNAPAVDRPECILPA